MKVRLLTLAGAGLFLIAATPAFAVAVAAPEIDASLAPQVITLLGGAFLLYRGTRK